MKIHGYICDRCKEMEKSESKMVLTLSKQENNYVSSGQPVPYQGAFDLCERCFNKMLKVLERR